MAHEDGPRATAGQIGPRARRWLAPRAGVAAALSLALVLAACGSSTSAAKPRAKVLTGGTATYALQATDSFSWMLPFENSANQEPWQLATDEGMWRPLYFGGQGGRPVINPKLSLAYPPVYSNHDTTVTIRLKHYLWSDGTPVTTADIRFFFELYKAGKSNIGTYVPGEIPDNIRSVDYVSPTVFILHLDRSYSQQWYTDNQLTEIFPLPAQAWDKTSAGSKTGNYAATPAGAKKVFQFLYGQSEKLSTYATNPLWQVVDGPWHLTGYEPTTGRTVLSVNRHYSGPEKPHLDHVVLATFTSDTAEVDQLRSGTIDYGWIPYSDLGMRHYFTTHGYTVAPWAPDYFQSAEFGYTSPRYGPLVRQLYIRQALQHLVNQPLYLKTTLHGIGQLTYGPAPNIPGDVWASAQERTNPDPYSIGAAKALLGAHGWRASPNGYVACERPGTGPNECGAGIAQGRALSLYMNYTTGNAGVQAQAEAFQTAAKAAGVDIVLGPASATTMFSVDGVCPPGPCNFAIALYPLWFTDYGDMSILPTGGSQFGKGNYFGGGYYSPTFERLLAQAHTQTGLRYVYATEDYLSRQVAALWFPTGDNQISVVKRTLRGWAPQNPFGNWRASRWYFVSPPG